MIDGTLKTSSAGVDFVSVVVSRSPAEDSDDEEVDDDKLSFRIEVKRVEVLRLSWDCCCFLVDGVVDVAVVPDATFAGVELACGDCWR